MKNLGQVTENQDIARKQDIPTNYVPTSRTVNGKALSSNISLTASDVGALPSSTTIPTVNNATLTIQKNGTKVQTFTANQSTNVTANITVPTKTSDLTNDSGFITSADLSSGVTSVAGNTGAVTASQLVSAMLTGEVGYGDKITAKDFTTSGKNYIKRQSGLMIQWGTITLSSTTTTITFAPPFQSTNYTIVASKFTGTMSNALYWHAYKFVTQSTTNITIQKGFSEAGEKIFWIAIGK